MRKFRPQTERFDSYEDLVEAAKNKYTLSYKDACKALKCSRPWADRYVRPNVGFIYLQNGKGTGKINYARRVSLKVNEANGKEGYSNESVYLDEKEFNSYIYNSIACCQKRSKLVYKSFFVPVDKLKIYYKNLLNLYIQYIFAVEDDNKQAEMIMDQMNSLYTKYASNDYVAKIINPAIVHKTKRTEAEFIDVPIPVVPIKEWQTVHDRMDYGDEEEPICREFFEKGFIRIEIKLPDKDGVIKEKGKVYYIADPNPVMGNELTEEMVEHIVGDCKSEITQKDLMELLDRLVSNDAFNIKQSAWIEYNEKIGNSVAY